MSKRTPDPPPLSNPAQGSLPTWWNEMQSTDWERAKSAVQGDWEKTIPGGEPAVERAKRAAERAEAEELARQQEQAEEARMAWYRAEEALRYGYAAQRQHVHELVWNPEFEERLRGEWTELKNGTTWEEALPYIRRGWEFAGRNPMV